MIYQKDSVIVMFCEWKAVALQDEMFLTLFCLIVKGLQRSRHYIIGQHVEAVTSQSAESWTIVQT